MTKLICKIRFNVLSYDSPIEVIGQVDSTQVFCPTSDWITIESNYYKNHKLYCKETIISNRDILEIWLYSKKKGYLSNEKTFFPPVNCLNALGEEES